MRHFCIPSLLLCLLQSHFQKSNAFQPVSFSRQAMRRAVVAPASLQSVEDRPMVVSRRTSNVIDKQDASALTFSGQIVETSRPLVPLEDAEYVIDFFKSERARNTLFVSDAPPVPIEPISPELFREWQEETRKLGVAIPSPAESAQQTVMQLCSNGISFSGLTVETTVFCGSKLIERDEVTGLPAYELTMISDKTQARGPRPLMWIYNQVMGVVSKKNAGSSRETKTTTSLCRISLVEKNGGLAINFESTFQVKMKFPRFLLKVLPVSKERAEQQGSAAVSNFVQKGVLESLYRFENAFIASSRLAP